ncbi:MAG: YceI family protein [Enhygromyxa sp.]
MRPSTLLLALSLSLAPTLGCPRPAADTEAASVGAAKPEPAPIQGSEDDSATGAEPRLADGSYTADPELSTVGFAVARATIGHIGKFEDYTATLELADGQPVALEIAVKTGSVVADRGGLTSHLKSADFFDVDKFPTATFTASEFTPDPEAGPSAYTIRGTMHLHGVGRKLEFPATLEIGSDSVVGRANLDISAKAFGIDYEGMEAELAEDAVSLEIELVFRDVAKPRVDPPD